MATPDILGNRLVALLRERGAIGKHRAISQAEAARELAIKTRTLQSVTLRLNELGTPVVSSCSGSNGIYLAATVEELEGYGQQLRARLLGNAHRMKCVMHMARRLAGEYPVDEETGQWRLFV